MDSFRSHSSGAMLGVSSQACVRLTKSLFPTNDAKAEYEALLMKFTEFPVAIEMCQAMIKFVFYGSSLAASSVSRLSGVHVVFRLYKVIDPDL